MSHLITGRSTDMITVHSVLLLQREDIDLSLRDFEGYTAFELYNTTVEGTTFLSSDHVSRQLYVWNAIRLVVGPVPIFC